MEVPVDDSKAIPPELQFPEKKCPRCGETKPRSQFYPDKTKRDGLASRCAICVNQIARTRRQERSPKWQPKNGMKTCNECGIEKPVSEYDKNKLGRFGLRSECKACRKIYKKERVNRPEHIARIQSPEYKTRRNAKSRELYKKIPPEKKAAMSKRWSARMQDPEIKERYRQINKIYRQTPRGRAVLRAAEQRRRALELGSSGTFTKDDITLMFKNQKGRCWYCQTKLKRYEIEHRIPLSRGGSNNPSNLVLSCVTCNRSKGAKLPHEWSDRLL
jgi:5-methylcytosine-specific restriction endonuclease McrA